MDQDWMALSILLIQSTAWCKRAHGVMGAGMVKVVGIVVLSALFLGERDLFTVRCIPVCIPILFDVYQQFNLQLLTLQSTA